MQDCKFSVTASVEVKKALLQKNNCPLEVSLRKSTSEAHGDSSAKLSSGMVEVCRKFKWVGELRKNQILRKRHWEVLIMAFGIQLSFPRTIVRTPLIKREGGSNDLACANDY